MVLDPLSAFSVACNVIQVIEFGAKILSKAADYRNSDTGALAEQKDLRDVFQSLNNLNANLQDSLAASFASNVPSIELDNLMKANDQCLQLSRQFIELLDRLKVRDRHAVLDSLRMSIKTLWYKDRMEAMEKSISQARDNLNVMFLVYMNSKHATQATQKKILDNTTRIEGNILQAVKTTSDSLHDDIQSLTRQLNNVSLHSMQQVVAEFTIAHQDVFEHLSNRLDSICAMYFDLRAYSDDNRVASARQNILDSLYFPQLHERRDTIPQAHQNTYRWILESRQTENCYWDNFLTWLGTSSDNRHIYWVQGKIGAGKTTLLRYLDDNISPSEHMSPWVSGNAVIRANCFFWSAGNKLQKSTTGLLRTILSQLFEQAPNLIPQAVQPKKWQTAGLAGSHTISWTDSELRDCLRECILVASRSKKIFLLVDGLDEFEGTDEAREDLIDLLVSCTANQNVKICLSSRPWNIFQDAFEDCPQLRVQDLTYNDVNRFVREQLHSNKRFRRLMEYDTVGAENLMASIVDKAAGIFLWVRLVVRELLKGLRDGDGIRTLIAKVEGIPEDLTDYFMHLMDSIEPQNRREASQLMQLALYEENEFISLHSNYLLDFSFIEEPRPDFALDSRYNFTSLQFTDIGAMAFRLESTLRKLNSRCMGLLVCRGDVDQRFFQRKDFREDLSDEGGDTRQFNFSNTRRALARSDIEGSTSTVLEMAHATVDFLHRSFRDFLLTPKVQSILHEYSHGQFDARIFFRNARLVQLIALNRDEIDLYAAIGLASYILSTLTIPTYRDTPSSAHVATVIQPIIENLVNMENTKLIGGWYLSAVLERWHAEKSTFLTLAIDFGLVSYVRINLTTESIRSKEGRPLLDYVLRPRFIGAWGEMCVGNQLPDPSLVETFLRLGADPNQRYLGSSIWAKFLCFTADRLIRRHSKTSPVERTAFFETLKCMLCYGADILLPEIWLLDVEYPEAYGFYSLENPSSMLFQDTKPLVFNDMQNVVVYAVSDMLKHFRTSFGDRLDELRSIVLEREAQIIVPAIPNQDIV